MAKKFLIVSESGPVSDRAQLAQTLRDRLYAISESLSKMEGVTFIVENFYHIVSTESDKDCQWRATCYVGNVNRQVYWGDIFEAINTIQAPCYESVSEAVFAYMVQSQQKDMEELKQQLGTHFDSLVQSPIDDVDHFINSGLVKHASNRTFAGFEGIQAVGKLKTLMSMTRKQIREAATNDVNTLIAAHC